MTRDAAVLEARRVEAVAEVRTGARVKDVAARFQVSRKSLYVWLKADNLAASRATGRPVRIGRGLLRQLFAERPDWKGLEFRDEIEERFGVNYDADHCSRLLRLLREERV